MRAINWIVLHCSDSEFGDAASIDAWHRARGWSGIGYHFVILNGYRTAESVQSVIQDCEIGGIEAGRPVEQVGAHAVGHNADSIGICLIGRGDNPELQLYAARRLIMKLLKEFPNARLVGHYELDPQKTCPLLDMELMRRDYELPGFES